MASKGVELVVNPGPTSGGGKTVGLTSEAPLALEDRQVRRGAIGVSMVLLSSYSLAMCSSTY